ncbi:ABC transporter ATP-binding protein [Ferrimicrobium sp.]|uniref:ABC transporter ATP-binding protein n=1 Tax=Ferrimicrobium sp. TaxID=2926050 RepID=UPI0026086C76|nr:ABC transporter ATP-binding protein [Ferrimicrobium sp.]
MSGLTINHSDATVDQDDWLVRAKGITKVFTTNGRGVLALNNVDLTLARGSFTSLIGPSGCGKSTLLRIVGGIETPSQGSVKHARALQVAFVFQDHALFPWLTVLDNVSFGLKMAGVETKERNRRSQLWIDRVGLAGFEKAFPNALSGGMRQRLSIARAFVTEPDVLLMDEPMGALDEQTRLLIQEDLIRLWEETRKTVLLVTHSIDEAILLGDQVMVMSRRPGRIKASLDVPLERPRTLHNMADPRFVTLKDTIINDLHDEVMASMESR